MATPYSIVFRNNSSNPGNVCVFQQDPGLGPNIMPLAWYTQFCYPLTSIQYTWSIQYSFVWGLTGQITPGVMFLAGQSFDADLTTTNQITLTYQKAYNFVNQGPGIKPGSLYITEDSTIPLNQAAVGIGMSGSGTFVQQAQPNMNLAYTPHPTYWIGFGNYSTGVVLDVQSMSNIAAIVFPPGVTTMAATLNIDNSWTIQPLMQANQNYVAAAYPDLAKSSRPALIEWGS